NSLNSRKRYARNLISRHYPDETLDTPLTLYFSFQPNKSSLQDVLFYHTALVEPTLRYVAESLVWPAIPMGILDREQLRSGLEQTFPRVSQATMKRMVYALLNLYATLNVAQLEEQSLRYQFHRGTLD